MRSDQAGATTKVDFSYYPYDRIEKGTRWRGLDVDSEQGGGPRTSQARKESA